MLSCLSGYEWLHNVELCEWLHTVELCEWLHPMLSCVSGYTQC